MSGSQFKAVTCFALVAWMGACNPSPTTSSTSPGGAPAAPSNLVASATSSSTIHLVWSDNSTDETAFDVEQSPNGSTWNLIATPAANATSYDDSGLSASTTYYYRIRATNAAGDSGYSNTAQATTAAPGVTVPAAPSNLVASATSSSAIHLAWTDNAGNETGFKLERSPNGSTWGQIATPAANATSYDDSGLSASTTYYYRIRATNSAGDSAYSNVAQATTAGAAVCSAGATQCVAGDVGVMQTCNGSGTGWSQSSCQGWQACTDGRCRNLCGLTADPATPTVCFSPIGDGVNVGPIMYWNDGRLTQTYAAGGATADGTHEASIHHDPTLAWPYYWEFNGVYSAGMTYVLFTLNQFGTGPVNPTLTARGRRAMVYGTAYQDRYTGAAWSGATQIWGGVDTGYAPSTFGPVTLNIGSAASQFDYSGGLNDMAISMTGDGYNHPVDWMDVNWVMLQIP